MEDINNTKTSENYIKKFYMLVEQSRIDGRSYVGDFLDAVIRSENINLELCDFLFKTADNMTEPLINYYFYLYEKNLPLDWYILGSFVNEERKECEKYFPLICKCIEQDIPVSDIKEMLNESSDVTVFQKLVDEILPKHSQEPKAESISQDTLTKHLIEENTKLNERYDNAISELNNARSEINKLLEESYANKHDTLNYKVQLEHIQKSTAKSNVAIKLAEGKTEKFRVMSAQLEKINEQLHCKNEELNSKIIELEGKKRKLENQVADIEKQLNEKDEEIDRVAKELEESRAMITNLEEKLFAQEHIMTSAQPVSNITLEQDMFQDNIKAFDDILPDFPEVEFDEFDDENYNEENQEDVIEIKDNYQDIVKHTNLFASILSKHYENKFAKKTQADQDNLIFIKMMEKSFSMDMMQLIKKSLKENAGLSRLVLYRMISQNASEMELTKFCKVA